MICDIDLRGFSTPEDWGRLAKDIGITQGNRSQLWNTLEYARRRGAKSCIVDHRYVDADYRSEYSILYGKTFIAYDSLCKRVLFFAVPEAELAANLLHLTQLGCGSYLGFLVIRPPEIGRVGRTVLAVPPEEADGHRCYSLCTDTVRSHFLGQEVAVVGAPYISQDAMVMTCAQCSIWVSTSLMGPELGQRHSFPYDITRAAMEEVGRLGRPLPSTGLVVEQMLNCLVRLGYNPLYYDETSIAPGGDHPPVWDPMQTIYPYVESGIPVIGMVPHHAFAIIGHLSNWGDPIASAGMHPVRSCHHASPDYPAISCLSSSSWASALLVNDDNIGPYSVLPVDDDRAAQFAGTRWHKELVGERYNDEPGWYNRVTEINGAIVLLPEKVHMTAEDCVTRAMGELSTITASESEFLKSLGVSVADWMACEPCAEELVKGLVDYLNPSITMRVYLARSSSYKARIAPRMSAIIPEHVQHRLLLADMSRYVWVVELSTVQLYNSLNVADGDRKVLGEIVFDPTANKHASYPWIAMHLPGLLVVQDRKQNFDVVPYLGFEPFGIYLRPGRC